MSPRSAAVDTHVTDHGLGFPAAFLPAPFDQLTRPDGARTGTGSGLGSGLSSVATLVRATAGHAHVTHRSDGGADVGITIPTSHDPATMTVHATDGST